MDLHHRDQGGVEVVRLRLLRVQNFDRKSSTRNRKDRTVVEVGRKLFGVQSRRSDDELQVFPFAGRLFHEAEKDVGMDGPFMGLVEHDYRVLGQIRIQ